ncbi:DUF3576 domain-containing protein [Mangrovicoccus algicola]|uniref:DUF3576 domain-containing protein n=1 Tax=Mangrovicoccus algicola TaxID=2771008 RepID=A0A8J6Z1Z1_9RHOB|nr:DUF3576 domain-containing protein [Mangrovicoccus algicola]MBE3640131.1 DUF3576 domain-containing protein [Mangrovicoccus algicola]
MGWAVKSIVATLGMAAVLAGCSNETNPQNTNMRTGEPITDRETIFSIFGNYDDPNVTLEVNRYIWDASLEVLSFLPVTSADPFSGLLVFGYGTPPGGGTAYRATVHVKDPALDARSLNLALATRAGPAAPDTVRKVEDAILTRARQLRIADQGM